MVVKWRVGIMEGCGQRVLTVMFGCEGEEVTGEWTELFIEGFFTVQQVLKWIRGAGNVAYMNGGNIYGNCRL